MGLILHKGATEYAYDALAALQTPAATATHVPLPHHVLVDMVKYALGFYGHEIVEETHAVTEDSSRYFGLLTLRSFYGDYTDTVGLRNSHDKTFPVGIAFGSRVMVCDNLAFIGDHIINRKHTAKSKRDLPGLVAGVIEPLRNERTAQQVTFKRYADTPIPDQLSHHAIIRMYKEGVINLQRIGDVLTQWHTPTHDWGDKSAWRLFNAATYSLSGRIAEAPRLTKQLHCIIDGICEEFA